MNSSKSRNHWKTSTFTKLKVFYVNTVLGFQTSGKTVHI